MVLECRCGRYTEGVVLLLLLRGRGRLGGGGCVLLWLVDLKQSPEDEFACTPDDIYSTVHTEGKHPLNAITSALLFRHSI